MVEKTIGPSPMLKNKSIQREQVERGSRANTGGDHYDRSRSNYSKTPPQTASEDTDKLFD